MTSAQHHRYDITPLNSAADSSNTIEQGDETFLLRWPDGKTATFHIWDYEFLYRHPGLYKQLIVELLDCRVYQAIGGVLSDAIDSATPLRVLDVACGSGLMGQTLTQSGHFKLEYLAGIEVSAEAITALKREQGNIYNDNFLLPRDDISGLKTKNLNCLILCGAANHLSLEDYQRYLALITEPACIAFNLRKAEDKPQRQDILQWMNQDHQLLKRQTYPHRKLANGSIVEHEVFLYCNKDFRLL